MRDIDTQEVERRAKSDWDRNPALREEFAGNFDAFRALSVAEARGLVKVCGRGAQVTGDQAPAPEPQRVATGKIRMVRDV